MLLEVRHLSIAYGDAPAVWDATLQVDAGEIVSVIGPNGAGKSTLVNAIAGLHGARSGELRLDGVDLNAAATAPGVPPGHRPGARGAPAVHADVGGGESRDGLLPEDARRARQDTLDRVYRLFPILRERRRQLAGSLSGGQQQMVAIGRGLMAQPRLLLLDEPSLGLAPTVVEQMFGIIRAIHAEGVAILLVEQNVPAGARYRRPRVCARGGAGGGRRRRRQSCGSSRASSRRILACATKTTSTVEGRQEMSVIKVRDLAYGRLRAPDLDVMEEFLTNFGMIRSARTPTRALHAGHRPEHHIHITEKGDPELRRLRLLRRQRGRPRAGGQGPGRLRGGGHRRARRRQARAPARAQRLPDRGGAAASSTLPAIPVPRTADEHRRRAAAPGGRADAAAQVAHADQAHRPRRARHAQGRARPRSGSATRWGSSARTTCTPGEKDNLIGSFNRCDCGDEYVDHHTLFCVHNERAGLNHMSFEVPDVDAVFKDHE